MPKKMIHTSLFPNTNCVVCNKNVKNNALHCKGCLNKWIESKNKQYHQRKLNNVIIKCDCELERHERAKMELDYNKCMDCKKQIQ